MIYCSHCGQSNKKGNKFCSKCGNPLPVRQKRAAALKIDAIPRRPFQIGVAALIFLAFLLPWFRVSYMSPSDTALRSMTISGLDLASGWDNNLDRFIDNALEMQVFAEQTEDILKDNYIGLMLLPLASLMGLLGFSGSRKARLLSLIAVGLLFTFFFITFTGLKLEIAQRLNAFNLKFKIGFFSFILGILFQAAIEVPVIRQRFFSEE